MVILYAALAFERGNVWFANPPGLCVHFGTASMRFSDYLSKMPRNTRNLPPILPLQIRGELLTGGNGTARVDLPARLAALEILLGNIQRQLDVQLQRIADLQVQLDRRALPRIPHKPGD